MIRFRTSSPGKQRWNSNNRATITSSGCGRRTRYFSIIKKSLRFCVGVALCQERYRPVLSFFLELATLALGVAKVCGNTFVIALIREFKEFPPVEPGVVWRGRQKGGGQTLTQPGELKSNSPLMSKLAYRGPRRSELPKLKSRFCITSLNRNRNGNHSGRRAAEKDRGYENCHSAKLQ